MFFSHTIYTARAINPSWTLIGNRSYYYYCSDSTFTDPEHCLKELAEYTKDCDTTSSISIKELVPAPLSFDELNANKMDTIETKELDLYRHILRNHSVLINELKSYFHYQNIKYSFIEDLDKFELLLKNENGDIATIFIEKQASSNAMLYLDKAILCR